MSGGDKLTETHLPRLGPPVLDVSGRVTFISEGRFVFDKHNIGFERTSAMPPMLPASVGSLWSG